MRLKLTNGVDSKGKLSSRIVVVNAETGEELRWVRRVEFVADADDRLVPIATIDVEVEVDIEVFATIEKRKMIG